MTSFAPPPPPAPSNGLSSRVDQWYWPIVVGASSVAFAGAFLVFLPDDTADPQPVHRPDPAVQTVPFDPAAVTVPVVVPGDLVPSANDADLGPTG